MTVALEYYTVIADLKVPSVGIWRHRLQLQNYIDIIYSMKILHSVLILNYLNNYEHGFKILQKNNWK